MLQFRKVGEYNMISSEIYSVVKDTVSLYIKSDFTDTTNLLGITSVRNIIYILMELENKINLKINDSFIKDIKNFTIEKLTELIPEYIE